MGPYNTFFHQKSKLPKKFHLKDFAEVINTKKFTFYIRVKLIFDTKLQGDSSKMGQTLRLKA